jgi:hypothetical protein
MTSEKEKTFNFGSLKKKVSCNFRIKWNERYKETNKSHTSLFLIIIIIRIYTSWLLYIYIYIKRDIPLCETCLFSYVVNYNKNIIFLIGYQRCRLVESNQPSNMTNTLPNYAPLHAMSINIWFNWMKLYFHPKKKKKKKKTSIFGSIEWNF